MTRDDIIRLAREAGAGEPESLYGRTDYVVMTWFELERFAALVSAGELEACAKVCDERASKAPMGSDEQCEAEDCAYAIRARGET
jgi:hypothetical protein